MYILGTGSFRAMSAADSSSITDMYSDSSGLMLKSVYENVFRLLHSRNRFLDLVEHDTELSLYMCVVHNTGLFLEEKILDMSGPP